MRQLLTLALVLLACPSWAAWTAVGTILNANHATAVTSWAPVTSAALEAGNFAVCVIAADETGTGTTDADCNQFTTVTDASSNSWGQINEWCNMLTSTAADGAKSAIYVTRASTTLASGAAITFNFSASTTRKAVTCMEFAMTTTTANFSLASVPTTLSQDNADPGSMSQTTASAREHLFVRGTGCESNVTTYTADTDYIGFTGQGTNSTSNSGTEATSMGARGEYRIASEVTSAASDPTYSASDCASVMVGFNESTYPGWWGAAW